MTLKEFEAKFNLNLNKIIKVINGHLYANTNSVKLYINKDIVLEDLNKNDNLYIIEYFDGYLLGKRFLSLGISGMKIFVKPFGIKLDGNWNSGYALDYHTIESTFNGLSWDTIRPPIAEELYRLKYWGEQYRVDNIAKHASQFLGPYRGIHGWGLDLIIPVPPSDTTRQFQPVYEIARAIGQLVGLPVDFNSLKKVKSTSQLKAIDNPEERREILKMLLVSILMHFVEKTF